MLSRIWIGRGCRYIPNRTVLSRSGLRGYSTTNAPVFKISDEVRHATADGRAVVALESTIYTHGFPYPANIALATRLEELVRANGGVPATIGILDGVARVGMNANELTQLVSTDNSRQAAKVSRRDLGFVTALRDRNGLRLNGGTTVSATMILAHLAGIDVFATGGLGGVHRGAEETMDVSADLTELGRTPVAVVSSGCKSFLDIPKTLEFLETQGVAVATFADGRQSNVDFPAFYSRDSGIRSPQVITDEEEAARVIHAHLCLGLTSGLAFANPIPEQHSIPRQEMENAINQALTEAKAAGAIGAASTPFILARLKDISGDKSVQANTALVESNVVRGTKVAVALQKLRKGTSSPYSKQVAFTPASFQAVTTPGYDAPTAPGSSEVDDFDKPADIFVAGSLAVDFACDYVPPHGSSVNCPEQHTSNPAMIRQTLGGVGYNVARAAHLMGSYPQLCSAVGDDLSGKAALETLKTTGMPTKSIQIFQGQSGLRTAQFVAVNDKNKDLVLAMADMNILERTPSGDASVAAAFEQLWLPQLHKHHPKHLVIDGNWGPEYLARWLGAASTVSAHVTFEPVSNVKSTRVFRLPPSAPLRVFPSPSIHLCTPNGHELAAMHHAARESGAFDRQDWWQIIDAMGIPSSGARAQLAQVAGGDLVDTGIPQQSIQLLPFIPAICTKLGSKGVLLTQLLAANDDRLTRREHAQYIISRCNNGTEETLGVGGLYMRLFPAVERLPANEVVSVNGVGDTFVGTLLAALSKHGSKSPIEDWIDVAQQAAVLTLKSEESVSPALGTLKALI